MNIFTLFYLLFIENIKENINMTHFKKMFQKKNLLENLTNPNIAEKEKIKRIREFELIENDTTYVFNLWKDINTIDF